MNACRLALMGVLVWSGGSACIELSDAGSSSEPTAPPNPTPSPFLDPTFGNGGITLVLDTSAGAPVDSIREIALQPDGRIVVSGYFSTPSSSVWVARFETNGALDAGFGSAGIIVIPFPTGPAFPGRLRLDAKGGILVQGTVTGAGPPCQRGGYELAEIVVARLSTSGRMDASFGTGGLLQTGVCGNHGSRAMALDSSDRLTVEGILLVPNPPYVPNQEGALARFLPDGTPDATFGTGGMISPSGSNYLLDGLLEAYPDSSLADFGLIAGPLGESGLVFHRYLSSGASDPSFGAGGARALPPSACVENPEGFAVQPDGKLLGTAEDNTTCSYSLYFGRVQGDGSPDLSLGTAGLLTTPMFGYFNAGFKLLDDGKFLVCGMGCQEPPSYQSSFAVERFRNDGTLDTTFGVNGEICTDIFVTTIAGDDTCWQTTVQPDGTILLAGESSRGPVILRYLAQP